MLTFSDIKQALIYLSTHTNILYSLCQMDITGGSYEIEQEFHTGSRKISIFQDVKGRYQCYVLEGWHKRGQRIKLTPEEYNELAGLMKNLYDMIMEDMTNQFRSYFKIDD